VTDIVARLKRVTDAERREPLKSGGSRFENQVAFARQYLVWAGLLDGSKRGAWTLTEQGRISPGLTDAEALQLFNEQHTLHSTSLNDEDSEMDDAEAGTAAAFTWVPLYRELAERLVEWEARQPELIALMERIREDGYVVTPLTDRDGEGNRFLLKEIDPFTVFGTFNRGIRPDQRLGILGALKEQFEARSALAKDFDGIPVLDNCGRPPAASAPSALLLQPFSQERPCYFPPHGHY
jgi:hypothetical protein